jgi:hypothetical protein
VIGESGTVVGRNGIDKKQKKIYRESTRRRSKGGVKISLDKMEIIYIINNRVILLFEN